MNRRKFLKAAGLLGLAGAAGRTWADGILTMPFDNGERTVVPYPQKRPLIRLTTRPPQLETPFGYFNEGVITSNDAFFVRYHLAGSPPAMEDLRPEKFTLAIKGNVRQPLTLSVADLKRDFEAIDLVVVNQCSGNGRAFFQPRVPGGQMGNGAMGNARWKGARLRDVLNKAGVAAGAQQVIFDGLDKPLLPQTPDYVKALDLDHAMDGDVMLAYQMNGAELPWLNGYPLRLVVPGYYGTYWIKHLHDITVVDEAFNGYWMSTAYRIPDNTCACVDPGATPKHTVPIQRMNVRSFITNLEDGVQVPTGQVTTVKGIAFDGGYGIEQVLLSDDGGHNWRETRLGRDLGKFSFREWSAVFTAGPPGAMQLMVRAINRIGQSQPMDALWNPSGYMRNVVETVRVKVF